MLFKYDLNFFIEIFNFLLFDLKHYTVLYVFFFWKFIKEKLKYAVEKLFITLLYLKETFFVYL